MQLAAAEVPGLDKAMERLLDKLATEAPFDFLKVAHHSSYNGLDRDVFDRLPARVYGHTGGRGSASHPHRDVLRLLEDQAADREWVRTDRNGRVGVRLGKDPIHLFLSTGHRNDYRLSPAADSPMPQHEKPPAPTTSPPPMERGIKAPTIQATTATDVIEIIARIPHTGTRVTLTIDIDPKTPETAAQSVLEPLRAPRGLSGIKLADGRELPRLLFVTSERLGAAIGSHPDAQEIVRSLRAAGHQVLADVPWEIESAPAAATAVRQTLASLGDQQKVHGVVLLGNYDVVPAVALDVLDAELRQKVSIPDQALALLQTKKLYAASIPHIAGSPEYTAVELKILQQFTCLGLGW